MTSPTRRNGGLVYSTEHGSMCPRCNRSVGHCSCRSDRIEPASPGGPVIVRRETSGRRGKEVTCITGVPLSDDALAELCRDLKKRCGSGGTVKDGAIEIQGDHRDRLVGALEDRGWKVKRR